MEKFRRVLAMLGVILLVFLYVMTLVSAILSTEQSSDWFIASLSATIIVPVVLYACTMFINIQKQNEQQNKLREEMYMNQMREQIKKAQEKKKQEENQEEVSDDNTNL